MTGLPNGSLGELQELAASLLSKVEQHDGSDMELRSNIVRTAREIIRKVGRIPEEQMLEDSIKSAEMVSKHLFSLWGAFEAIPTEGSISLEELGRIVKCDPKLLGKSCLLSSLVPAGALAYPYSPLCAHVGFDWNPEARWQ